MQYHFWARKQERHVLLTTHFLLWKFSMSKIFPLKLKNEQISKLFASATEDEVTDFWSSIRGVYWKDTMDFHTRVVEFIIGHWCLSNKYTFDVLKCGVSTCTVCSSVCLPCHVFKKLGHIPHPTPVENGHYPAFSEVFGIPTTEDHQPSFKKNLHQVKKRVKRKLLFYATVQHVKNPQLIV